MSYPQSNTPSMFYLLWESTTGDVGHYFMNKHALLFFSTLSFGNDKKIHGISSRKSNTYDQCFILYIISFDSDRSIEIYSIRVITKLPNSEQIKWESWSWSYGSWIYKYLCNQCLSPLKLWVRTPFMARWTRYNITC